MAESRADSAEVLPVPPLSTLTTIRVGGAPRRMVEPRTADELAAVSREVWESGDDWLLLAGGSNTVAADDEFDGTVIRVATRGIDVIEPQDPTVGRVRLHVQAGEPWDAVVAFAVRHGWAGIETLSGIPGSSGAAPVQNIGAYGGEIESALVAIDFLDFQSGEQRRIASEELGLGYRTSALKRGLRGVVIAVELELADANEPLGAPMAGPIAYAGLADALGMPIGSRVSLAELRRTVLSLRASKGMLLDDDDPDSVSAGSFFTNPIVRENFARSLPAAAPRWPIEPDEPDMVFDLGGGSPDLSALGGSGSGFGGDGSGGERRRGGEGGEARRGGEDGGFGGGGSGFGGEAWRGGGSGFASEGRRGGGSGFGSGGRRGGGSGFGSGGGPGSSPEFGSASGGIYSSRSSGDGPSPYLVKLSAAWLIENAGIRRGFALPGSRAAISAKHTLALINCGGATAAEIAQLATFVQSRVQAEFGLILQPEPVLVGLDL